MSTQPLFELARLPVFCRCCGRRLKSAGSVLAGIGPVCARNERAALAIIQPVLPLTEKK